MPFQPGRQKTGGRVKGVGKRESVAEICQRLGCDPFEGMVKLAQDIKAPKPLRARMFAELASYLAPKLRAVEHTGPGGEAIKFRVEDVRAYAQSVPDDDTTG
jgi:hypothetical protein